MLEAKEIREALKAQPMPPPTRNWEIQRAWLANQVTLLRSLVETQEKLASLGIELAKKVIEREKQTRSPTAETWEGVSAQCTQMETLDREIKRLSWLITGENEG